MENIKKIISNLSALYKQNIISYAPKHMYFDMLVGTNTSHYDKNKYKIFIQTKSTFDLGIIKLESGEYIYKPERLFIDLNKFSLESTVKKEALTNLEKIMNPQVVKSLYEKLKHKRRGIDKIQIENYLSKNLMIISELIKQSDDVKSLVREYIMALLSKRDIPLTVIKGGSSIELYTTINRSTLDIDTHVGHKEIKETLQLLFNPENIIYFSIENQDAIDFKKRIIKLKLVPHTRKTSLKNYLENIVIPISLNTSYSNEELVNIINDFKLSKQPLRRIKNASALIFSREMLLAEKYQSLISKPENTTREKYLLDLFILWNSEIDFNLFMSWLFKKWSRILRNKLVNQKDVIALIEKNKDKELLKIKTDFNKASKMYDLKISFVECLEIYNNISTEVISYAKKHKII